MNKILLLGFFIFVFAGLVFAPETVSDQPGFDNSLVPAEEPAQNVKEEKPYMNNYGPDFGYGMPFSLADPKYVAQQKFIESMTSVYNWVSVNSKDFIVKCDANKEDLVKEVVNVINDAEEKSDVCKKFESEVKECNPESFCKNFQKGKLHLPPEVKFTLKKMGKDLDKMEIKDLTEDLLFDVCKTQLEIGVKSKSSYYEKTKDSIKAQLPAFRSKCEEFKKWQDGMGPQIKLPDFYIPKMQQPKSEEWKQQEYKKEYNEQKNYEEHKEDYVDQPQQVIDDQEQQEDGQDKIEEKSEQDEQQQEGNAQEEQEPQEGSSSEESSQESSSESSESSEPSESTAETAPTFSIKMPMGLAILPSADVEEVKAETEPISEPVFEKKPYTAICGNDYCEPDFGENPENCHDDCTPNDFYKSSEKGYVGPSKESQGMGPQGFQGSMGGPGMSPEMMCELTDDELVEIFTPSDMGMSDEEMKYNCKKQSSNMWSEMSMLKLENAKCLANASLDCASKEKLVENCNIAKSNPENVAKFVVNNLCRQFGVKPVEHDLYELADKWLSVDPALAYELGDTVDTTIDDEKDLGTFSYVFGDGEYSDKMKEKAKRLGEIKQRIEERGIEDPETVKVLEEQEKEFNNEADKFGNFFNFSRFFG